MRRFFGSYSLRTSVQLLLVGFAPLLAAAWLTLSQLDGVLVARGRDRLADAARSHALTAHARLLLADAWLRDYPLTAGLPSAGREHISGQLPAPFSGLGILHADGTVQVTAGSLRGVPQIAGPTRARLAQGGSLLVTLPRPPLPARLFLMRSTAGAGLVAGELDLPFLWRTPGESGAPLQSCVLGEEGEVLNCPNMPPPEQRRILLTQREAAVGGSLDWKHGGTRVLGRYQWLDLREPFQIVGWTFLVAQPEEHILSHARGIERGLLLALAVAGVLVILVASGQVRRTQRGVAALADAIRKLGVQDPVRVPVPEAGELRELSAAIEGMACQLGFDAAVQRALTEIDRQLSGQPDLERAARQLASRMRGVLGADLVALSLQSQSNAQRGNLYLAQSTEPDQTQTFSVPYETLVGAQRLMAAQEGIWLRAPFPEHPVASLMAERGATIVLVVPIAWNRCLVGTLMLGFADRAAFPAQIQRYAGQFADRMATAFSVAVREEKLVYHARFDVLTGLPNRQSYMNRLAYELERAGRESSMVAAMLVNLDEFKSVNDTLGHAAGDDVIRQAAARLAECVRDVDTVARFGADEFALLLPGLAAPSDVVRVAAHLSRRLAVPFLSGEHERILSASVGAALFPADASTADALVRNADTAMHRAKQGGGGKVVLFESRMNDELQRRVTVERELRRALESTEFVLYYQPQMDARSGALAGAEVLIRWQHPDRGLQSPAAFIEVAEQTGLIDPIGELVLRKACEQLRLWRAQGTAPPRLSVNVSGRQFKRREFAALVGSILRQTGVDPRALELEITETLLMEDADASGVVLNQLAQLGIRLAIDDFGTGYSSLAYLKRLRFDALKIDRSFVGDVTTDDDSRAIASAIIALARTLRKQTVAEGVETQEQLDFLRAEQCDLIQGFLISRPVPGTEFIAALRASVSRTRSALRLAASA